MDPATAQQQAIARINQASNILVTVRSNPSVDQLAACIGLTLLLNRLDKHATAVFSGQVPSTLEFLQPEETIEKNPDSLRDFIISLDKDKADKLRYKVEDEFVRIFITPYKTSLSEEDLLFSQGDYNVEVVIALGVHSRNELDAAITAHGRILHDASIISLVAGKSQAPDIGQINWLDSTASSLCEMLVLMAQNLGPDLIDNQMATAFLTGIVAETNRFSNDRTTPRSMNIAAQLMTAGANQQLIVSKLEPQEPGQAAGPRAKKPPSPPEPQPGVLSISHHPEVADTPEVKVDSEEIQVDEKGNVVKDEFSQPEVAEAELQTEPIEAEEAEADQPVPEPALADLETAGQEATTEAPPATETVETAQPTEEVEAQMAPEVPTPPQPTEPPVAETPQPVIVTQPPPAAETAISSQPAPAPQPPAPVQAAAPAGPPQIQVSTAQVVPAMASFKPSSQPLPKTAGPRPHALLNPADHQPSMSPAFTADTKPGWDEPPAADPLLDNVGPNGQLLRSEQALTGATSHAQTVTPPVEPTGAILHPTQPKVVTKAPPPPVPPPLLPTGSSKLT